MAIRAAVWPTDARERGSEGFGLRSRMRPGVTTNGGMPEVTRIPSAVEPGDAHVAEQLLPLVYHELGKLAARKLPQEKPGQTLQATALVHEACLRQVDTNQAQSWTTRPRPARASSDRRTRTGPTLDPGPRH
jgi:hypothetical protein